MNNINDPNILLSKSEARVLEFVTAFILARHYAPSLREIVAGTHLNSISTVAWNLGKLADKGLIGRAPGVDRGLWLINHE